MSRKSNPNSSVEPSTTYHVDIPLGSSPRNKPIVAAALAEREGIPLQKTAGYLFFDWKDDLRGSTNGELDHRIIEAFGPGSFVAAIPPSDPQALQKAEDRGDLWLVDEGWHRNPGAMAEMRGATGEPRNGQQLALLNSRLLKSTLGRILQEARSHTGQDQRVLQGMEEVPIRVPVLVDYVTVGGLGSGSACWFLDDGIRSCAEYNGVQANIVVHATCRGSLSAKDVEKADLNESIALRYLQALPSGQYLSPLSGQRHPAFDTLFLWSNENCHGDMTDLGQVMVQRGHCQYFLYSTDAGARMRTALVDILDHTPNEHGAPRPGLTMGLASLTRDSDRLLLHCQYDAAATMAEALRAPSDPEEARQEATHLARQLKIVESGEENILTAMLSHPSGLDGESVIERAKASFQSRTAGTGGLEAAFVTEESLRAIIDGDIPQVYGAMVREHARNQAAWVQEALQTYQQKAMKRPDGLSRCLGVLALFDPIVRQSAESLMAKARELTELARPHEQIVAEASEQVSELAQRSRPARWVNHLLIRRLSTALQESGISLITYTLEITVCEIAVAEFLTPITEQLDRLRGWLTGMDHKLIQTARICEAKAHSAVEKRTILTPPLGIELVTKEYARDYCDRFIDHHGGQEAFTTLLSDQFVGKYGSFAFLADASLEEYEQAFTSIGEEVFRPQIESENVFDEFKRVYPQEAMQLKIANRLVKHSEGSIRTTGETNEPITWIKTVNAPTPQAAEWLGKILPRVDKKSGPWDVAVTGNRDRMDLAQLRGGICLQSLIDRTAIPDDPSGWARLISHAPDPVSVLIVPPDPTVRQLRRVLAKAIVTGQITIGPQGRYHLDSSNGEQIDMGDDPSSVEAFLKPRWAELVFVESTFGRNLVVAEEQTISALKDLKAQIQSGAPASDRRLGLIDLPAVEDCLTQAELLLPRTRRMAKAIRKKGTS